MVSQKTHLVLLFLGLLCGIALTWYGFSAVDRRSMKLPPIISDALPGSSPQAEIKQLTVEKVVPYPNETAISTYPVIAVTIRKPFSRTTDVAITPRTPFLKVFSSDNRTILLSLQRPLKKQTQYKIQVYDDLNNASYTWAFTTGDLVVDERSIGGIERVKQQLPYRDPNGQFTIYYAPQTDVYFITIHDDERGVQDKSAALAWFKSQGVAAPESLHLSWQASNGF